MYSPFFLHIPELLIGIESYSNEVIPEQFKKLFREKYFELFKTKFPDKEIVEPSEEDFFILTYVTDPEDYVFWLSVRLSMHNLGGVTSFLNYANNAYYKFDFKGRVRDEVYPRLEDEWIWTPERNLNDVFNWFSTTIDTHDSIFDREYIELVSYVLFRKLSDYELLEDLRRLILNNETPIKRIPLNYKSMLDLCELFSVLKKKDKIKLSISKLAAWIYVNLTYIDVEGEEANVGVDSIETYIAKKYPKSTFYEKWF